MKLKQTFKKWLIAIKLFFTLKKAEIKDEVEQSNSQVDPIIGNSIADVLRGKQEVDNFVFKGGNNLVAEFAYEPQPVYAGIHDETPMYWLNADGLPMDEHGELLSIKTNEQDDELLEDDIDFIKQRPDYIAPQYPERTQVEYKTGIDPYRKD